MQLDNERNKYLLPGLLQVFTRWFFAVMRGREFWNIETALCSLSNYKTLFENLAFIDSDTA